jgi:starch synthase
MHVDLLTREYPPEVYGGAGVHVAELARCLRTLPDLDLRVRCFGGPREEAGAAVEAYQAGSGLPEGANGALRTLAVNAAMAAGASGAELVHSHTWYTHFAGHAAKLVHGIPHVATSHSLEPRRPWKAEQLGGGYELSSFLERASLESADAVIAVSHAMRADILECYPAVAPARVAVVHNGIDTDFYRPDPDTRLIEALGVDPRRPYVLSVGRLTRQKGLVHLLRAVRLLAPAVRRRIQLVMAAASPDTPEIQREFAREAQRLRQEGVDVLWFADPLAAPALRQLYSHAAVFVCPSLYEPLGIVNLEAMACGAPVVASAVGGIPEVVVDGETGRLVPVDPSTVASPGTVVNSAGEPPEPFAQALAEHIAVVLDAPAAARALGTAGRDRAVSDFSWHAIARETRAIYASVLDKA